MTIEQLWFGWAAEGAQGVNKQQIIAGSGVLTESTNPTTIKVLAACYAPPRTVYGWMDHLHLRVVFRRRQAGLDGRGRPGRFFVHALAAEPAELPAAVLARLWSAKIWVDDAPTKSDPHLDTLGEPRELRLGEQPAVVRAEHLRTLLAAHLWNLARGGRSALEVDDATAVAVAAALSDVLPPGLALRGFSTEEAERHAQKYDLLAGAPPTGQFGTIAPDTSVSATSRAAAELLLEAAGGDDVAGAAVGALAQQAATREALAASLHRWATVDRRPSPHEKPSAAELASVLALAARDEQLALRLVDSHGRERVAEAFLQRMPGAREVIRIAAENDRNASLAAALQRPLAALGPRGALAPLEELAQIGPRVHREILGRLTESWAASGAIATLRPAEAVSLARSLVASGGWATPPLEGLTSDPAFAGHLATARDLPVGWRARAVATLPDALSSQALASALTDETGFAEVLLESPRPAILDAVAAVIDVVPPTEGLRVVKAVEPFVSEIDADEWRWSVYRRCSPSDRLFGVSSIVRHRGDMPMVWMDRLLDAYVETIWQESSAGTALRVLEAVLVQETSTRASAWKRALGTLQNGALAPLQTARVVADAARGMQQPHDLDAIREIAVDKCLSTCQYERQLAQALRDLRAEESRADMAVRLARAAHRWRDHPAIVTAAVVWIALRVHEGHIPPAILEDEHLKRLRVLDDDWCRELLIDMRSRCNSLKPLRRWLGEVVELKRGLRSRIAGR